MMVMVITTTQRMNSKSSMCRTPSLLKAVKYIAICGLKHVVGSQWQLALTVPSCGLRTSLKANEKDHMLVVYIGMRLLPCMLPISA